MLRLVLRRAVVQRRLLTSVIVLVATASVLVGVCSLMLSVTEDRALQVAIEASDPEDVSVTAFLVEVGGDDVASAKDVASRVVTDVMAGTQPRLDSTATSRLRALDEGDDQAYLTMMDDLENKVDLTSGRWPEDEGDLLEAVIPTTSARLLDLDLGDEVTLGRETGLGGDTDSVTVVVVGTFRPRARSGWERDPLAGTGFSPAYSDGLEAAPTYGPFVIPESSFLASGSSVRSLRVTANPTLTLTGDATLQAASDSLGDASGVLRSRLGDRSRITRLASELSPTLARLHAQQASTRATVLVVLLLGSALALASALMAGWLVASVREDERGLLLGMGLSRRQRLMAAGAEALLLSLAASVLAVPAAAVAHSRLTHLSDLRAAGLQQGPAITWGLVGAVLAAAVLLSAALLSTTLSTPPVPGPASRGGVLVRLGVGPVLLVAAVFAWWQLRDRPATASGPQDVTLTLAPVLCLAALTLLAVRIVPVLLAQAAGLGSRSRSLIWPLATQQAARRTHAATAMVLVAAATASAVFGLALSATWQRSQVDQAALRVGTDLVLTLPAPPGLAEAGQVEAAIAEQSREPTVSAAIRRPLALGRYIGDEDSRPVLVAVDTGEAGTLLRGRTEPGQPWADVGADLTPTDPVASVPLPEGGAGISLRGRSPQGAALTVTPTAVVQDAAGFRSSILAESVPLDGAPHPAQWLSPPGAGLRLVGLQLEIDGYAGDTPPAAPAKVQVVADIPASDDEVGDEVGEGLPWQLLTTQRNSPVGGPEARLKPTGSGTELRARFTLRLDYFEYSGASVIATAFPEPPNVPVVVSRSLADAVGAKVGDELAAVVGERPLALKVAGVVPTIPSAPGEVAVLADIDALSRALIDAGQLDSVVDAWWVSQPTPDTVRALRGLGIGDVTVREEVADELAQGPLRVTVPPTLLTLVVIAAALLLAAVGLVLGGERHRRSAEVVRLRALGLSRRDARRLLLAEHVAFFVPLLLVGTLVGVAGTLLLGPHLITSDLGASPVPSAEVAWPWAAELVLIGALALGTIIVSATLTGLQVRRSDSTDLRAGER